MKVHIVTDSTAYLPDNLVREYGIVAITGAAVTHDGDERQPRGTDRRPGATQPR